VGPGRPGQSGWPVDTPGLAAELVGFRRTEQVVYATLLDLAARGVFGLEVGERGPGWVCLVDPTPPEVAALRPYERMVWEHVVARAAQADRSAPINGLEFGSGEPAKAWQSRFARCVEADARQWGLLGPRSARGCRSSSSGSCSWPGSRPG
jgi:hypothetical protein